MVVAGSRMRLSLGSCGITRTAVAHPDSAPNPHFCPGHPSQRSLHNRPPPKETMEPAMSTLYSGKQKVGTRLPRKPNSDKERRPAHLSQDCVLGLGKWNYACLREWCECISGGCQICTTWPISSCFHVQINSSESTAAANLKPTLCQPQGYLIPIPNIPGVLGLEFPYSRPW